MKVALTASGRLAQAETELYSGSARSDAGDRALPGGHGPPESWIRIRSGPYGFARRRPHERSESAPVAALELRNGVEFSAFDVSATAAKLSDGNASPSTRGTGASW